MHRLLTDHPVYRRAVEEVERTRAARTRHQERIDRAEREYRAAQAAHLAEAREAVRDDRPPPVRPTPPDHDPALAQQLAQEAIDAPAITRQAEAQLAPEVLPLLDARAAEIEEAVHQVIDVLRPWALEMSQLRVSSASLRSAAGLPPLVDQGVLEVPALLDAVLHGHRLLEAESPRPTGGDAAVPDPTAPRGSQGDNIRSFSRLAGRR